MAAAATAAEGAGRLKPQPRSGGSDSSGSGIQWNRSPLRNYKPGSGSGSGSNTPLRKPPVSTPEREGPSLPKFGQWNVSDPTSGNEYSAIFEQKIHEKREGGSLSRSEEASLTKKQPAKRFCCFFSTDVAEG